MRDIKDVWLVLLSANKTRSNSPAIYFYFTLTQRYYITMPSAIGYLRHTYGNRVEAHVNVDGTERVFSGNINPPMEPFSSSSAEITYNDDRDLTAMHSFYGQVTNDGLDLNFDNNVTLKGNLDQMIAADSRVQGGGQWSIQ